MTKREICKRLFDLYNLTFSKVADTSHPDTADLAFKIAGEIRWLLLDITAPEEHEFDLIGLWRRTGRLEPSSPEEQKSKEAHETAEAFKRLHSAGIVDEYGKLTEWYRDDNADQGTNA